MSEISLERTDQSGNGLTISEIPPTIVYDGHCPFCSNYVQLVQLQESIGRIKLVDARDGGPVVNELTNRNYDLDDGMVLILDGEIHHGSHCIHHLSLLSTGSDAFNRFNRFVFRKKWLSALLYPFMRSIRNFTISILGRSKINPVARPVNYSRYMNWTLLTTVAVVGYIGISHPKGTPGLKHVTDGKSEIFPFFNWSLFSSPHRQGIRLAVEVVEAAPGSLASHHIGEIMSPAEFPFLVETRFRKSIRGFYKVRRSEDIEKREASLSLLYNFLFSAGVLEFNLIRIKFDPLSPDILFDERVVAKNVRSPGGFRE